MKNRVCVKNNNQKANHSRDDRLKSAISNNNFETSKERKLGVEIKRLDPKIAPLKDDEDVDRYRKQFNSFLSQKEPLTNNQWLFLALSIKETHQYILYLPQFMEKTPPSPEIVRILKPVLNHVLESEPHLSDETQNMLQNIIRD